MKFLIALALLPRLAFAGEAINGSWKGTYSYEDGRPPVAFELRLCVEGSQVHGSVTEPNTFGDGGGSLGARVEGSVSNGAITFRKTYDGSGGASHSVNYEGSVAGGQMNGTWRIPPNASGTFEVTRDPTSQKEAGCVAPPVMMIRAL